MSATATAPRRKSVAVPPVIRAVRRSRRPAGEVYALASLTAVPAHIAAAPCGGTAAWSFDGAHRVTLDPAFHTQGFCLPSVTRGSRLAARYATALLRHERGHGMYTTRDIDALLAWCKAERIAFGLLNLAEDLRIEHILRAIEGKVFGWESYNALPTAPVGGHVDPLAWLSSVVFLEASIRMKFIARESALYVEREMATAHPALRVASGTTAARVRSGVKSAPAPLVYVLVQFVADMVNAPTTLDLLPLLRDWVDTFPAQSGERANADGEIADPAQCVDGDMRVRHTGRAMMPPSEMRTRPPLVETEYPDTPPAVDVSQWSPSALSQLGHFLLNGLEALETEECSDYCDTSSAPAIANRLGSLLGQVNPTAMRVASSGHRLHMAGAMLGESQSFRQRTGRTGAPRMVLVVDQSGSMNGQWREHGAAFVAATMALHQQGRMEVTVILTGDERHVVLPSHTARGVIDRLACLSNSESVDRTLQSNAATLRAADIVVVYTDGHLTDDKVDAAAWRSRGVNLIGACVASGWRADRVTAAMRGHFGSVVVAASGTELATKLVQAAARAAR